MANIQHSIQIAAKPESVYPLIATAKGFAQWWAADITESGGAVELGFFNRATIYRLRLTLDKPTQVDWLCETGAEWIGTHIAFLLEARGSATVVRFTHGGWQSETDYFTSCNTTWGELMFRLKSAAEGKSRGPLFLASDMAY
ncbi:MAG TPA: SRPBCC domain-containing protein [Bryobacteraceae bacterium]|nr:SRPBCC domain-containing protein [Bryobacteraceae bacterium]